VFASRSTFRPNGLGLSLVRLEGIEWGEGGPVLLLGGIDMLDHTPVYDVKPYLPYAEAVPDAAVGYAAAVIERLTVVVDAAAGEGFGRLAVRAQAVVMEVLALDPRPATQAAAVDRIFGAAICGCDVRFTVAEGICRVVSIETAAGSGLNG
jgi:tRNA (adenine37-N6)-methyltransferase